MASSCLGAYKVAVGHLGRQPIHNSQSQVLLGLRPGAVGLQGSHGVGTFPSLKSMSTRTYGAHRMRGGRSRTWYIQAAVVEKQESPAKFQTGTWTWSFKNMPLKICFEEYKGNGSGPFKDIIMLPTISDVSTTEEWQAVAKELLTRELASNWRIVIVDWPGFGRSDSPSIEYNAEMMEKFLVDFLGAADGPFKSPAGERVIVGGGHAATIALCGARKGLVEASAIIAVAPTWAGPLPIVFGRDSSMETRYGLLRTTLRAPALGWMMYNVLVSNQKSIESQYKSHVYADSNNVTPSLVESRYALTKREGARYAPAAFLTGLLDPVQSREEFLALFAELENKIPIFVISTKDAPKRSKAEMEALQGAKGVTRFVEVPGALLPQEEYPYTVTDELYEFSKEL
uniref:TSA: Wollemia nobilis Ref_Wollemi_Transcript_7179_1410 transcribed RNA sequence n=1 Tax=Wollemia nobilis TaxID=56998 RepID=A0A0C9RP02_9CONI